MTVGQRFGANLSHLREQSGITQEELSFRAGLHRTEIGLLERGERVPKIDTAAKLAGSLGVTLSELLDGIEWHPGEFQRGYFGASEEAGP